MLRVQLRLAALLLQLRAACLVVRLLQAPAAAHPDRVPVRSGVARRCCCWAHPLVLPRDLPWLLHVLRADSLLPRSGGCLLLAAALGSTSGDVFLKAPQVLLSLQLVVLP